jgi:hypothetical protein
VPDNIVLRTINYPQVVLVSRNGNWVFYRTGTIVITPRGNTQIIHTAFGSGGQVPQRRLADIRALYPNENIELRQPEPPVRLDDWIAQQTGDFSVFKIWP